MRDNACDSVESTIDDVIISINGLLSVGNWSVNEKTPMSGYYEVKENTIVNFSKTLIESYNYPKEKVISFLKNYILNRYKLDIRQLDTGARGRVQYHNHPEHLKSYPILLDTWLGDWTADGKRPWFNNLYIINKSYLCYSMKLDPTIDYYSHRDSILAIPNYFRSLILSGEEVEEDSEDSVEYSSADEENSQTQNI